MLAEVDRFCQPNVLRHQRIAAKLRARREFRQSENLRTLRSHLAVGSPAQGVVFGSESMF